MSSPAPRSLEGLEPPDGPILLTGGSGSVGQAIAKRLSQLGWPARGLVRSDAAAAKLEGLGLTLCFGDLTQPETLDAAVQGCSAVIHAGGANDYCLSDSAWLFEVNVRGSLNLFRAAERAGLRRFVHTSSAVTIGEAQGEIGRETSPHRGHFLTEYERSKYESERTLLDAARRSELELVCLNPASVQGPGRVEGTGKAILDLARGRSRVLVDARLAIVDIDDCADAHLLALSRGEPRARYLLCGFDLSLRQLSQLIADLRAQPLRQLYLPLNLLPPLARLAETGSQLIRRQPRLCPETARNLTHAARYDGSLAERKLGLDYRDPETWLRRLLDWYANEGWIPALPEGAA